MSRKPTPGIENLTREQMVARIRATRDEAMAYFEDVERWNQEHPDQAVEWTEEDRLLRTWLDSLTDTLRRETIKASP